MSATLGRLLLVFAGIRVMTLSWHLRFAFVARAVLFGVLGFALASAS